MSIDLIEVEAKGQAEVFLRTLFEPDDIVEIRPIETYRDDNGAKQSRVATQFRSWGTIDEVLGKFEQLQDANRRQHLCIFFGVNPRTQRGGGTKTDVSLIRALYVDVDGVKPEAALHQLEDAGLPSPNIVLNSGHGTHFYWVLAEPFELVTPEDRDRVEILLKGLCGMLDGGDTKAGEIARILRIPGFQNMKFARNGEPATPCFLHRPINDHYYDIAELEEYLTPSDPPRIAPNNGDGAEVIDAGGRRARCLKAMLAIRVNGETDGSNRLFSYACRAVEFDLADADAIGIIREYERHRPFPKAYSDAEITNRLRHAERRVTRGSAKGKTRVSSTAPKIEPHKSFPVDALPEPVRSFVTNGAKAIGCALCFLALPLLAALASAIGNARRIQLKRGWVEPPILWTAIIGESGTQKTPAFSLVLRPLRELQSKALAENAERMGNFERERLEYDVRLKKWKHKPEGDPPEAPEEPQPARFIVNDSTIEALATILASNPRGVLLARDELAGWMDSFDRYANGKGGGDAAHWLSIHRAEAITMDRKTGQRIIHVPRPAVSIAGGIQPRILARSVQGRHRENGLAARLLMASPPPKAKRWTEADIPPESEAQLAILFDRLLELRPNVFDGEPEPVIIPLDTEAKKLWVPFYNEHNEEQADMTGDLAAVGLVEPSAGAVTLGDYVDAYIVKRTDVKPRTKLIYQQARRSLIEYFGPDKPIRSITEGDADDWRLYMVDAGLAENTYRKRIGIAKQIFRAALRAKLIGLNPFTDLVSTIQANPARKYFVTREEAHAVLDACPDAEWRLIFALARYGGLRVPSEILTLGWADVDWERGRMTIHSPKTEHHPNGASRQIPLFPELAPYLQDVFELAEEGAEHVITRYRSANSNLRTQLLRIIKRAGLTPWTKPFHNLRATRETELAERWPIHVVCKWIGNSQAVAAEHYLQVTDDHFKQATEVVHFPVQSPAESARKGPQVQDPTDGESEFCGVLRGDAVGSDNFKSVKLHPRGFEPLTFGSVDRRSIQLS